MSRCSGAKCSEVEAVIDTVAANVIAIFDAVAAMVEARFKPVACVGRGVLSCGKNE